MTDVFKENLLKLYPEYDRVTGPYKRKDGREHIVLNNSALSKGTKEKLRTLSYPKAIIEVEAKRQLTEEETVDHIDKNPLNNELSNLQILSRSDHAKLDVKRRKSVIVNCTVCNKENIKHAENNNLLCRDNLGKFKSPVGQTA